jgi:hypothetical protein
MQLPEKAAKPEAGARKPLPFTATTEYQDGMGAPKEEEHCPVLDIYRAGLDPDYQAAVRAPPEVGTRFEHAALGCFTVVMYLRSMWSRKFVVMMRS